MNPKSKAIGIVTAFLVVFLLGFLPQFQAKSGLRRELEETQANLLAAQRQIEIDNIRALAGRVFLEASRQNYGTAREHATLYFDKTRELAEKSEDLSLKTALSQLLIVRDAITSGLTQANASVVPDLQSLLDRTYSLPNAANTSP